MNLYYDPTYVLKLQTRSAFYVDLIRITNCKDKKLFMSRIIHSKTDASFSVLHYKACNYRSKFFQLEKGKRA